MAAGTHQESDRVMNGDVDESPEVSICESCPGKAVFIETGNTDGWIASDLTVDVTR